MTKTAFINKYGAVFWADASTAEKTECTYAVVVRNNLLLCRFDKISGLYSFPEDQYLSLTEEPTLHYTLHAYVEENNQYFKQTQNFRVYEIEKARINSPILSWQLLEDILVSDVPFDETLRTGFNNLFVRLEK